MIGPETMVGLREPQRWDYGVPDSGEDVISYGGPYRGGQVTVCVYADRLLHTCAQPIGRGGVECSLWSTMHPPCDGYFMCPLGWAVVPRYLATRYSRCVCEGVSR